jgi:uncharacterized protein (DUF2141 family)
MTLPRRFRAAALACAALSILPFAAAARAEAPAGCVGKPSNTWITIVAEGMRNGNGLLAITPYPDVPSRFLVRHGSLGVERVPAAAGTTRACLFLPKPGVYAIALYHDENADRHLDRTGIGLPAEGYGFSNNPATLAGLPSFRSVRLNVPRTGLTTRIQMKYP